MPNGVTASAVLIKLEAHLQDCAVANIKTANALDGLLAANTSMAQAHRDLAAQMGQVSQQVQDGWKTFNRRAWLALGAIGMSILAGGIGMVTQSLNADHTAAQVAAAAPANNAKQQQILAELAAIRKQLSSP